MGKKTDNARPSRNREKLIWAGICLGVSFWMFCLGILVGRGTAPVHFDTKALQKELAALKRAAVEKTRKHYPPDKTRLDFYEALKRTPKNIAPPPVRAVHPTSARAKAAAENQKASAGPTRHQDIPEMVKADKFNKPARTTGKDLQDSGWTIQVAAVRTKAEADRMVAQLTRKGFAAYRLTGEIPGKGLWHRIRVGHYRQRGEARSEMEKLRRDHYSPYLTQTGNRRESP